MGERATVLNSQISEALDDLKMSVVQSTPSQINTICFGHKVCVRFENDQRELTITLVGKNDARLQTEWISCESPIGIALLGKSKLDKVLVNDQPVTILEVSIGEI